MAQPARLPDPQTTIAMDPQPPHPNEAPTSAPDEGSSGPPTAVAPTTGASPIADPATPAPDERSSASPIAVAAPTDAGPIADPAIPAPDEGSSASPIAVAAPTDAGPIAAPPTTEPNPARRWIENPMQALLVTVLAFLFGFVLTQTNDRITRLEDKVDAGFTRIDERFAQQDTKFDERFAQQDEKLDEINLKLTALISALNATAEVEAALNGRLLDPNAATTDDPAN